MLDQKIAKNHVLAFDSRDRIANFFDLLGYNVQERTIQTSDSLGINDSNLKNAIKHIEEIANQEGMLRVLLVEIKSVTVAHTQTLMNSLCRLASDFLVVLTDDYERIDFVLLQRIQPDRKAGEQNRASVKARPRVLTVDRQNPDKVTLRVLRRLTYTGVDPLDQYEKLCSAFDTAEWSEPYFDNRALFSDYCLNERVPEMPEWSEDVKNTFYALQNVYNSCLTKDNDSKADHEKFISSVFEKLGFSTEEKTSDEALSYPYYVLYKGDPQSKTTQQPVCLCLKYPFERALDAKDYRDKNAPEENPAFRVVSLLRSADIPFAIVTNGRLWRLYTTKTHSMATRFYQVDLPEILGGGEADAATAFRYFYLFFRAKAFESKRKEDEKVCFLDRVLQQSREYAKKLEGQLKDRVFERIFPHFARGFINSICAQNGRCATELTDGELEEVYQATLSFLYRLLFLLYAESRNMLPVRERRGYHTISLARLKSEIAGNAGKLKDRVNENLETTYSHQKTALYDRLMELFKVVDKGARQYNVPTYNGGLFVSEPAKKDAGAESRTAAFLSENPISDLHLAFGLDHMARDLDEKTLELVFIDYKSLGVRQLGSIYEGLLEFKVRVADKDLCVVKEKNTYRYKPKEELSEAQFQKLDNARATTVSYGPRKGEVYLENDKGERKASGSYYTPEYIVDYIVEHTVGPVIDDKVQGLRPKLREAQKTFRTLQQSAEVKQNSTDADAAREAFEKHSEVVDEIFDIKVLDPAMGSGHFLVEAVDIITHRLIEFLNAFPWNPVGGLLEETRRTILREMDEQDISINPEHLNDVNLMKRHVMKRCIYGVDLNPMAVELAKVSLWLDCFTLGAPLSFLDHHLRCGNSLVGTDVKTVEDGMRGEKHGEETRQLSMFAGIFTGLEKAAETMIEVGELTDSTAEQVRRSVRKYKSAEVLLAPFKAMLDVWVSRWFGNDTAHREARNYRVEVFNAARAAANGHAQPRGVPEAVWETVQNAMDISQERRFFHWELEFPEVWRNKLRGEDEAGFDAVIGNPPWGQKNTQIEKEVQLFLREKYLSIAGIFDWFRPFIEKGVTLLRRKGFYGMILPDIVLLKNYQSTREYIIENLQISHIDWWGMAFPAALIDASTIIGQKREPSFAKSVCLRVREEEGLLYHSVPQEDFRNNPRFTFNLFLTPTKRAALQRIEHCPRIMDYFEIHEGVHSGNMRKKLFVDKKINQTCQPLIVRGEELRPFRLNWNGQYINLKAFKQRSNKEYANVGKENWYKRDKLLIRRTGDSVLAAVDQNHRYASNNFFIIFESKRSFITINGLCALLNSKFITCLFRTVEPRKGRVFAEIKIKHISNFPLPTVINKRNGCSELNELGRVRAMLGEKLDQANSFSKKSVNSQIDEIEGNIEEQIASLYGEDVYNTLVLGDKL